MNLSGAQAQAWLARPDPQAAGLLLYGQDPMRVALRRQEVIRTLVGPDGEAEMRLTRMQAADLRKDPALVADEIKAQGFFPGQRVVFVEEATDAHAPPIAAALADWQPGDAQLVVTAGALRKTSKLVRAFADHRGAVAIAIYADPPSRDEIARRLAAAGVGQVAPEAMADLEQLARALDPGEFAQTVEKLALYKGADTAPVSGADLAHVVPASTEAELDDVLHVVAEARAGEVGPVIRRLRAQGVQPVGLVIAAMRHFRALYAAAAHPDGASQGMASLRPPVYGPRRDRMLRQAQNWGAVRLEQALTILTDTDLALRSAGQTAPAMALVERALVRLSMLTRGRN